MHLLVSSERISVSLLVTKNIDFGHRTQLVSKYWKSKFILMVVVIEMMGLFISPAYLEKIKHPFYGFPLANALCNIPLHH